MSNIYQKSQLVGGSFQDPTGLPLSGGKLVWQLNHDGNICTLGGPTGEQVTAGVSKSVYLDMNGSIAGTFFLWTNDVLMPSGSYYTVRAYNNAGIEVWNSPQAFVLTYAPTINVGTLQPIMP